MDFAKAVGIFFLTFASEDLATVSGGLLAVGGEMPYWLAFLAVFLGIWIGDFAVYAIARVAGPPVLKTKWFNRIVPRSRIEASEAWFREKGWVAIVLSRFMPGTRVPIYASAGLLRMSPSFFLILTGVAAFVWVVGSFFLLHLFGRAMVTWFEMHAEHWGVWVVAGAGLLLVFYFMRKVSKPWGSRQFRQSLKRWEHWEFWPAWLFYAPLIPLYAHLALKYRGLTLPAAANPGIPVGGFVGESKYDTLEKLQKAVPEWMAASALLPAGGEPERDRFLLDAINQLGLKFPIIIKPDVGQRGVGVKVMPDLEAARKLVASLDAPLVVQEYLPGPLEAGVFYLRDPESDVGRIFAVTRKEFPTLTGDGKSPLRELILRDARASLIADTYFHRLGEELGTIPEAGETVRLVRTGNHAQGCIFHDGMGWATPDLLHRFDRISRSIDGFYFGRYDVRFEDEEAFKRGEGFRILELNGASSEATSIYDPKTSLLTAYQVLFEQWDLVFRIGARNRDGGVVPPTPGELLGEWFNTRRWEKTYPYAD